MKSSALPAVAIATRDTPDPLTAPFPLPLTPFELLMLLDDRPDYPMTFRVELVFRGRLECEILERAVVATLARHPLLQAVVRWTGRNPHWEWLPPASPPVQWISSEDAETANHLQRIDLTVRPGILVSGCAEGEASHVWLQFHHACCDGMGARRFIADLLTAYARCSGTGLPHPEYDALDFAGLRDRHRFTTREATDSSTRSSVWKKLRDAFEFHFFSPQPLAAGEAGSTTGSPHISQYAFSVRSSARLKAKARAAGTRFNDVALALLFQTLAEWNRVRPGSASNHRLRILMPTDLRTRDDANLPAANRMSYAFLSRTIGQSDHWESLLAGVRRETQSIQQLRTGLDFLSTLGLAQRIPRLLPWLLRARQCFATAVLTNLGDPTRRFRRRFPSQDGNLVAGNLVLERIFGTPPIRPLVHAGFGLCWSPRQLCLTMLGDPNGLGESSTELLAAYRRRWHQWGELIEDER